MRNLWVVFICSIFVFVGCGGDSGVPAETTNGGEKNGESNGGEGNGGEGNGGEGNGGEGNGGEGNGGEGNGGEGNGGEDNGGEGNGEECEPVLECPAGQCGEIDDGCGGVVECAEPCGCVDGAVQDPSCGICNLGSRVCQPGETGFGRCEELNVPGVSSCDDLVFIDPMTASHGGRGTKDEPLATIAEGLEAVRFRDAAALILAGDSDVEYEGPILLEAPLSIIGGFDSEWVANNERVKISSKGGASWLGPKDIVGVSIWEVDEPMVLANLFIKTDDAVDGGTNYGVHVHESPRLTIRNVEVGAGRGGSGSKGDNGVKGSDGDKGKDAVAVGRYKYRQQVNPLFVEYLHQEPSPGGGENNSCAEAKGGAGGTGGVTTIFADSNDGRDGQEALEAPGGRGASGGTNYAGENGGNAPTIQPTNASHGLPIIPARSVVDGAWVSERAAQRGSDGRDGSGGGGGGGGRAGFERAGIHFYIGSHGGGGGAGGCGGTGGKGGQAGGSSFGLFLSSSDITVENSSFYAANGGRGGDGGEGGRGGDGGLGGSATQRYGGNIEDPMVPIVYQTNEKGGDGGKGARGQNGGNGGGGAGGVSYGAYCYESEVTPVGTVIFESGAGGAGGKGGSQEFDGEDGLAEDVFKCF